MLKITDTYDLKKYLETRVKMATNYGARGRTGAVVDPYTQGMIFGIEESLKAVQALIDHQHSHKKET